jgi:hypothetical protein
LQAPSRADAPLFLFVLSLLGQSVFSLDLVGKLGAPTVIFGILHNMRCDNHIKKRQFLRL